MKLNFDTLLLYLEIEKIIVFGNKSTDSRDVDLVIISNDFNFMFGSKRKIYVKKLIDTSKRLDLICVTLEEYKEMERYPTELSKSILEDGEIVYDRTSSSII